ncbi:hypothetical protein KEM56_001048 [Ascosphaera pollenicola]|nr:hypothetical protein KEM56_001048 [Ascosphaera pollenicola]
MSSSSDSQGGPSPKRLKSSHDGQAAFERHRRSLSSFQRPVSPPSRERSQPSKEVKQVKQPLQIASSSAAAVSRSLPSPFHLTHIRDMAPSSGNNVDTIQLQDILGDPLIKECWQFNYCFDVDWLMEQFDPDVRQSVVVKVVHGSWKRDSPNRQRIDDGCKRHANVEPIVAYMPEPFGTHHSKMMVLIRHDDQAQVIIHTANMIPGDWANMSQAVWRSPLLPKIKGSSISPVATPASARSTPQTPVCEPTVAPLGSGQRFKRDLLAYLRYYGTKKTGKLVTQLERYDFSAVRGALIASVPSKQRHDKLDSSRATLWGWPAMKDALSKLPLDRDEQKDNKRAHIVIQISSVATLGPTDKWLTKVLFDSLSPRTSASFMSKPPKFSIIFPDPDEIRRSLNGYGSGGSIHMRLQSTAQKKQLQYLRKYLCHWAGDSTAVTQQTGRIVREAGRRRAAPHIKTYIRFTDEKMTKIDWGVVTSANLSTQAWGATVNNNGEIRICSWEIGVLVWPELFITDFGADGRSHKKEGKAVMVPVFKRDTVPDMEDAGTQTPDEVNTTTVAFRMPYDLPLTPYGPDTLPWTATGVHTEPDWMGQTWGEDAI